ncbi:MAG TPA: hypothetical protein VH740_12950 [Vicinamibacterales bacterium]
MADITIRSKSEELKIDASRPGVDWNADARVWANVMRNRSRWVNTPEALEEVYRISAEQAAGWGFDLETLRRMRGVEIVEIELPVDHPDSAAIRALPWEFILSAAITAKPGLAEAPLVLRHVRRDKRSNTAAPAPIALFVQSAPGKIADRYHFDSEYSLVREALPAPPWTVRQLKDPDLAGMTSAAAGINPSFVHLTGVDRQQGAQILADAPPPPGESGVYLKESTGESKPHSGPELADAIAAAGCRPACVSVNTYYSSEIAAAFVDRGADTAIGFLAEFDDSTAEVFFSSFYRAIAASPDTPALVPFRRALEVLLKNPATAKHVEGAPIVIWTTASVREDHEAKLRAIAAKRTDDTPLTYAQLRALLHPYYQFPSEINYCGVHNGRSIFSSPAKLGVRNPEARNIPGVLVDVTLTVSGERSTFSRTLEISLTNHEIDPVCLSLTSEMVRALRERIQANLTVEFSHEGRVLLRESRLVGLLATDEWDNQSPWLPSFVLPRDPAVLNIVRWAQPILNSIADASDVGFDNYLRLTGAAERQAEERLIVDRQVRALWWALRHRCRLSYLAAAPVYTSNAQRIRTPSAVLSGRAGTCLDLALLFTACLAAVDLHAVVFVFRDHALPGYVRSPGGHTELAKRMSSYFPSSEGRENGTPPRTAWILGPDGFDSVLDLIRGGELVPLETVALTERGGFEDAIRRGGERLQRGGQREFVGLYDLTLARRHGVTPLPIAGLI